MSSESIGIYTSSELMTPVANLNVSMPLLFVNTTDGKRFRVPSSTNLLLCPGIARLCYLKLDLVAGQIQMSIIDTVL